MVIGRGVDRGGGGGAESGVRGGTKGDKCNAARL
jgi:hypothetical protein